MNQQIIVASLLLNLESVTKRTSIVCYFFSALTEPDALCSFPENKATGPVESAVSIPRERNGET